MAEAVHEFGDSVSFAEVNSDQESALCAMVGLMNVPSIAYFVDGELVATLIGADQNIRARVLRLLAGKNVAYDDGTDES